VPRIAQNFLDCVVCLYRDEQGAYAGEPIGGTGFLVAIPVEGFTGYSVLVVTNEHNIERGRAIRLNTAGGDIDVAEIEPSAWITHPEGDDLAIGAIGLNVHHQVRYVGLHHLLSKEMVEAYNIGIGDDVFVVGRFIRHDGKQRNQPTVRFGAISQMPGDKILFPDGREQESFLVEARSIAGYSGSPVFIERHHDAAWGPRLLGVDHCHLSAFEPIRKHPKGDIVNLDWYVENNTGMMGVVPAWKLAEMFEMPEVKDILAAQRDQAATGQERS
jgi:hypothetical protein